MKRIMAIDYGDARIGLAVSDLTGLICGEAWTMQEWNMERASQRIAEEAKNRDVGTGAIVQYLGKQAGFAAIVRNKFVPRKEMISDFILAQKLEDSFFLDIHGMKVHKNFDLAIGTGYLGRQKYADVLKKAGELCRKYKIKYRVNLPKYSGKIGLTGRLQKATGRPQVLQLEFSPSFRDVEGQ